MVNVHIYTQKIFLWGKSRPWKCYLGTILAEELVQPPLHQDHYFYIRGPRLVLIGKLRVDNSYPWPQIYF